MATTARARTMPPMKLGASNVEPPGAAVVEPFVTDGVTYSVVGITVAEVNSAGGSDGESAPPVVVVNSVKGGDVVELPGAFNSKEGSDVKLASANTVE